MFRLEACVAVWLQDNVEIQTHLGAAMALQKVYLPRIDGEQCDEEAALLWAALRTFDIGQSQMPIKRVLSQWRSASPNAMRWLQAHQIVHPFGLELWPTARHMHRIVNNIDAIGEAANLDGLLP